MWISEMWLQIVHNKSPNAVPIIDQKDKLCEFWGFMIMYT